MREAMDQAPSQSRWTPEQRRDLVRLSRQATLPFAIGGAVLAALLISLWMGRPSGSLATLTPDQLAEIEALRADAHRLAELAESQRSRAGDLGARLSEVERRLGELTKLTSGAPAIARAAAPPQSQSSGQSSAALEERMQALEVRQDQVERRDRKATKELLERVNNLEMSRETFEASRLRSEQRVLDRLFQLERSLQTVPAAAAPR
jgi:hypothetical protein